MKYLLPLALVLLASCETLKGGGLLDSEGRGPIAVEVTAGDDVARWDPLGRIAVVRADQDLTVRLFDTRLGLTLAFYQLKAGQLLAVDKNKKLEFKGQIGEGLPSWASASFLPSELETVNGRLQVIAHPDVWFLPDAPQ